MCYEVASATTNLSTFIFLSLTQMKVFLWITFIWGSCYHFFLLNFFLAFMAGFSLTTLFVFWRTQHLYKSDQTKPCSTLS